MKVFESENGIVTKYVFCGSDGSIKEAVLYMYKNRVVICCSTQSGCKVGCKFCGTGNKFIRDLQHTEIYGQVLNILNHKNLKDINEKGLRFQIMFMSMGEPMHNWHNVSQSIMYLNRKFPNAELLISTVGIRNCETKGRIIELSKSIDKIGLQFSIHKAIDSQRRKLIPHKDVMSLYEIRDFGIKWALATQRPVYLNYCVDDTNSGYEDFYELNKLFTKEIFNFTFSVICSKNETMKDAGYRNLGTIRLFENLFIADGYNTRIFNPDGQDDIGGGCGQLWYFQKHNNFTK